MITNHDRSGWFGASDTQMIMGSWNTKTFARWWLEKLGVIQNIYTNTYMMAGTHFEHRILDQIGTTKRDRQIKKRTLRLRVNLDGETHTTIREVKTHLNPKFTITKGYWGQAQVQMYAAQKALEIVAYQLEADDYNNFYREIDPARLSIHPIAYDSRFIKEDYLPRIIYLCACLKRRKTPRTEEL
jgi:YqaJ-like viral recombinase domain.